MNKRRHYGRPKHNRWRLVAVLLFLLFFAHIQHSFVFGYRMIGTSMEPQFMHRDHLVGVPLLYGNGGWLLKRTVLQEQKLRHGDVILVYPPQVEQPRISLLVVDYLVRLITLQFVSIHNYKPIVRRVIALEGDQLYMQNHFFYIKRSGETSYVLEFELTEAHYAIEPSASPANWDNKAPFGSAMSTVTVPHQSVFVAADNRILSLDSRHWGSINTERVRSVVVLHIGSLLNFNIVHR